METPRVPINFVSATAGESFLVGTIKIRILEDGSRTGLHIVFPSLSYTNCRSIADKMKSDNRIGTAEFTLPPHTPG